MGTNKLVQIFSSVTKGQSVTISNFEDEIVMTTKLSDNGLTNKHEVAGMTIKLTRDEAQDLASELKLLSNSLNRISI